MTATKSGSVRTVLRYILINTVLAIIGVALFVTSALAQPKNILFLNSYHVGYKWSDEIYQGFLETLEPLASQVALHVEYLDMKRHYTENRYENLAESFAKKYADIPIDLVVSADDAAFLFLKRYGQELFPGVPVLFCGTNYLNPEELKQLPNFYGITEKASIQENFATILDLFPETEKIFIINDLTVTGRKVEAEIRKVMGRFEERVRFIVWDDISMPELITNVNDISPENSVVFYTFFFRDSNDQQFEYDQSMSLIYRQCPVPIFGAWDFNLGHGLTGGLLTSGYQQGKAVAKLARDWLGGTPLHKIPKITSSPNHYMFDYNMLQKFSIPRTALPEDSIVINVPVSFYQKHRTVILASGVFIAFLVLIILLLTLNIIQRRKAQKKIRQSEKNFRSIFTNANDGLYQASSEGNFIRVNPALAQMLQYTEPKELVENITDIDNQLYTDPGARKHFLARLNNSGWARGEHSLYCKDGSTIDVMENAHMVTDEDGHFQYYEGSITDMTEYKKTQELISQTEKLISLGGVSAGIAHEIRSPLTSIIQGTQIIQSRIFENNPANLQCARECKIPLDTLRQYLKKRSIEELLESIYEAGKRTGSIIEDMLSFSRKSLGNFSSVLIEDVLESALQLASKDYSLKNLYNFDKVKIRREFEEGIPPVSCSPSKIRQVFFNIIKNSIEAMGDAGTEFPSLTFRIQPAEDRVHIEIADNGPGINDDVKKHIFDPFFTTKDREKGTGLGLSVSYYIIKENHHGDLRVISSPGQGTAFIIELPYEQLQRQMHEEQTQPENELAP